MIFQTDRRNFLKWSGTGIVSLVIGCRSKDDIAMMPDPGNLPPEEVERVFQPLTTWLRIANDGTIEVAVQKAEMGQGVHTTLPLMIAEELDADLSKMEVKLVGELPPYSIPGGLPMTYGSTSVSSSYG